MDDVDVRAVGGDEWSVVAWLWQCFRHDLATVVNGLPYADGRYATRGLPDQASSNTVGYLAWRPHLKTEQPAPIAFAVIDGLNEDRRSLAALWVAPVVRSEGIGHRLALDVIGRHPGPWSVAYQHDNVRAGTFWRRVADDAFGSGTWREDERRVPGLPAAPPDHWIETI